MAAAQPGNSGTITETSAIPDTTAGRRLREVIDLINAGNPDRIRDFAAASFTGYLGKTPPDEHVKEFLNFRGRTGGLEFHCARYYESPRDKDQLLGIVRAKRTGLWWHIDMVVRPEDNGAIRELFFGPTATPRDAVRERPPPEQVPVALAEFVERLAAADAFCGAVLLARDGTVLYEKAFGIANRDCDMPNRVDTRFNLASAGKMFTAVAIAQLVERGNLAFGDSLDRFLSADWLSPEASRTIRIEHLLTHTSGLGDYFDGPFQTSSRLLFREVSDYRPLVCKDVPRFPPGSKWSYSNTGYLLLGAVIEKVSGRSYFEHVRENVFAPAGMSDTDSFELDRPVKNLAVGYSVEYGPPGTPPTYRNNVFRHVLRGSPAGGGYSTVRDLLKFDQALRSGKLLRRETFERMITSRPDLHQPPDYACGFVLSGEPGGRIVGHGGGGGDMGINASFLMYLDSGYTAIVLSNSSDGAEIVEKRVVELLPLRR